MPGLNVPLPGHGPVLVAGVYGALSPGGRALDPAQQAVLDAIRSAFRDGVTALSPLQERVFSLQSQGEDCAAFMLDVADGRLAG